MKKNEVYEYEKKKIKEYLGWMYQVCKNNSVILAGGAILSIFSNKEVEDFDFYFRKKEDAGNVCLELEGKGVLSYTDKSLLISGGKNKYNVITFKYFENAQDVFDSFDFTVSMGAFDFATEEFIFDPRFYRDIIGRKLIYSTTNEYPLGTMLRINKYQEKGFQISKREMIKIGLKVSTLNIDSIEEAEKHIQGMYGIFLKKEWEKQKLGDFSMEKLLWLIETVSFSIDENKEYICNLYPPRLKELVHGLGEDVDDLSDERVINYKIFSAFFDKFYAIQIGNYYKLYTDPDYKNLYIGTKSLEEVEEFCIDKPKVVDKVYVYKYVKRTPEGRFVSFYDKDFEYKLGKEVEPSNKVYSGSGIYTADIGSIPQQYNSNEGATLLRLVVSVSNMETDDLDFMLGQIGDKKWKKAFVDCVIEDPDTVNFNDFIVKELK